jgi:hypothetical protein
MGIVRLNEREQLIVRILRLPEEQIPMAAKLLEALPDDPNWGDEGITPAELERRNKIDLAAIAATAGEPTFTLEDVMRELNIKV